MDNFMEASKNINLIEKYLREELSDKDKQSFEQQLEKDTDLAEHFAVEKEIFEAVQIVAEEQFRGRLSKIQNKNTIPKKIIPLYQRRWFLAASVLFLLGIAWFLSPKNEDLSPNELFAAHYIAPEFNVSRNNTVIEERLVLAETSYRQKDYAKTIQTLESYQLSNSDTKLNLIIGSCYLEMGQLSEAVTIFERIQQQSELKDDATWYLALTHLKAAEMEDAKKELRKLLSNEFSVTQKRKSKAKDILKHL